MTGMDDTIPPRVRWFHLTPGRLVLLLLVAEALFFLSNWLGWPAWHKGYAVLTCVAAVGVTIVALGLWFAVATISRLRFQFSIRSLLLMVGVIAIPSSWMTVEVKIAAQQSEAGAIIRKFNGCVSYDYEIKAWSEAAEQNDPAFQAGLPIKAEPSGPVWLRGLLGDDFFNDVVDAELRYDAHVQLLKCFPRLIVLRLADETISNLALAYVPDITQLQELTLTATRITDSGIRHLAKNKQLRKLDLNYARITDAGLETLAVAIQLQELKLDGPGITDAGLRRIEGLSQLQRLDPTLPISRMPDWGISWDCTNSKC